MRVFVTGGTGFIGRHTLAELKRRKHRLLVLSRKAQRRERGVDFIKGGLTDVPKWKKRLARFRPEAAVHLAWEGVPDFSYSLCVKNLVDGLALFPVLAEAGCKKIVALGTGFELGAQAGKVSEDIAVAPTSTKTAAMVAAKHALHILGETMAKEKGIDFIWLRPFTLYGEGQRSGSLIPSIIHSVAEREPLTLNYPLAQCDFVHAKDVARAIADAAQRGKGQKTYNVGNGKLVPVRMIAKIICEEMGVSKKYYRDFARSAKGPLAPAPYAKLENTRKGIGWRPSITLREGLRTIVKSYQQA